MRQIYLYDEDSIFKGVEIIEENGTLPENSTDIRPEDGLYKAKFDGEKWIETITQEEIERKQSEVKPETTIEELKEEVELLKGTIIELTDMLLQ